MKKTARFLATLISFSLMLILFYFGLLSQPMFSAAYADNTLLLTSTVTATASPISTATATSTSRFTPEVTAAHSALGNDFVLVDSDVTNTTSIAWGDMDSDGDLDIVVGNRERIDGQVNLVYRNEGDGIFRLTWESPDKKATTSITWGDMDSDGDLDLAVGNDLEVNQLYRNEGDRNFTLAWESSDDKPTRSVAWGDMDSDGDLDLAVGNDGQANQLYRNDGDGNFTLAWESSDDKPTRSVAWGDVDSDGDLDLAVGNDGVNELYRNDGDGDFTLAWQSSDSKPTRSVAWGDMDSDGDLDLAVGNDGQANQLYPNDGDGNFTQAWEFSDDKPTRSVAWGDMDSDGDLDLAVGNYQELNQLYRNDGDGNFTPAWQSSDKEFTTSVAWGDIDSDGDLDLGVGHYADANLVYLNEDQGNMAWQSEFNDGGSTSSIAWGDMDSDGDLDFAVGNDGANELYRNEGNGSFPRAWQSPDEEETTSIAWGDMDSDGDLDLAVGNYGVNQLYRNEGNGSFTPASLSPDEKETTSIAWGDMDSDGDLDLAVGNYGLNQLYRNDGDGNFTLAREFDDQLTNSIAWGDMDSDGDLDLAVGNGVDVGLNQIYRNEGDGDFTLAWESSQYQGTTSVAWGDMDSDGDLDLAVGYQFLPSQLYRNEGNGNFTVASRLPGSTGTKSVAWGDMDSDGDLDLALGNDNDVNQLYRNEGHGTFTLIWRSLDTSTTRSVAWGDMDSDGDLDLAIANGSRGHQVVENRRQRETPNRAPYLMVTRPGSTAEANFYSSPDILTDQEIPIRYTLFDPEGDPVTRIEAFYSLNGGGNWLPAIATSDTITTNLATMPYPMVTDNNSHLYTWDTFASGFFGQSDNVVLRFVAHPQDDSGISNNYQYTNQAPGPYLWAASASTTSPFRVRGSQIRVYSDTIAPGQELASALVYRLPADQSLGAEPIANHADKPLRTNQGGYLQGLGELALGDQLVALLPITSTESYTLYHTSAAPTTTGLDTYMVTTPGVQELVVKADNPLMVFDLDVSLEWDARRDSGFLAQLELDLKRTSQFLYDWSNGQIALGKIRVYHAKENWLDSHIIIPATNNLRPGADLGGIVSKPISETLSNGQVITNAYLPGQVRMAPEWNRFGNFDDELQLDWPRTLAHELGHYLLFLPDNYLGEENGQLIEVDCPGSAMTSPYRDDYSEFLTRSEWRGDCLRTVAHQHLGRTDWETITSFYNMLDGSGGNRGPSRLPLNVTKVTFVKQETAPNTLLDPFFYLTDENGSPLQLPMGSQGYLFKTNNTPTPSDDMLIALGSPFAEHLLARGAEPGDRLCLFDYSRTLRRLGCLESITQGSTNLRLHEVSNWQPQISVASVTSRTLAVTVTQPISSGNMYVQIFPAAHPTTKNSTSAPLAPMLPIGSDTFTQTITLDYPIANLFVRVWTEEMPLREEISHFFLSRGWGPGGTIPDWGPGGTIPDWGPGGTIPDWGPPHRYGWGIARRHGWHAPISSSDGKVMILDLDDVFGDSVAYGLQSLSSPANLPPWLTPVGQAYRFSTGQPLSSTLSIMFDYLQREVPGGEQGERRLWMAYSPDEGESWQLLKPSLDTHHNLASAQMPGEGIYALISTIHTPLSDSGWFAYLGDTTPTTEALASIEGYYSLVAHHDSRREQEWIFHDPNVEPPFADLVNQLTQLELEQPYFIHVTEPITLYVGTPDLNLHRIASNNQTPPALFYGWIAPSASFTPTVGMAVRARIDGELCGETTIQELDGQLAYYLQVAQNNHCDVDRGQILFEVGDWLMAHHHPWNNRRAWYHPLTTIAESPEPTEPTRLFLPLILRK